MPFDPSILSEIGGYGPNPVKAQSDAYTLAGQQQDLQMGGVQLAEAKQKQSDETKVRALLKDAKLDTFEDQTKVAQQITKINPKMGMDFMARVQQGRAQETQLTMENLQLAEAQSDALVGAIDPIVAQLDQEAQKPGANPAMLDAKAKQLVIPAALQLRQQRPDLAQFIDKFLQDPQGLTYQGLKSADAQSKRGNQAIKDRLAERRQETSDALARASIKQKDQATAAGEEALLSDEDAQFNAQQYIAGDKSVLQNIGRGKQGAQNIVKLRHYIRTEAEKAGMGPQDVAARIAEFSGYVAEQRGLGTRLATITVASEEANKMIALAKESNKAVPRGQFLPWNQIVQGGRVITNDPAYAKFAANTLAVINTWARAIAPTGVPTVADKDHAHAVLNNAQSPEAYDAVLDQFQSEIQAALAAPKSAKARLHDAFVGGQTKEPEESKAKPAEATGETQTYQGKTYRLKPGADRSKRENWEVVGG